MQITAIMRFLRNALVLVLVSGAGQLSAADDPKRHPAAHVIRITAGLTFDGKPVHFDELIDCQANYTGTPTTSPHMTFRPPRMSMAREIPGGGMIMVRVSREFCYVNGDVWGSAHPAKTAPDGWTPVLEWYDNRDLEKAQNGIIYVSETALTAENGRLRIIEPFRITIPKHPPSPALIADAASQIKTRDVYQGSASAISTFRYKYPRMHRMFRIPESEWRNPERAKLSSQVGRKRRVTRRYEPDYGALADQLSKYTGSGAVLLSEAAWKEWPKDAKEVLYRLRDGRWPSPVGIYDVGIPKSEADRFGLLFSRAYIEKRAENPFFPDRFDEYVPFKCVDGVMTPDPANPGLIYWFNEFCGWGDHHRGFDFFGKSIGTNPMRYSEELILDLDTGDLWWLHRYL